MRSGRSESVYLYARSMYNDQTARWSTIRSYFFENRIARRRKGYGAPSADALADDRMLLHTLVLRLDSRRIAEMDCNVGVGGEGRTEPSSSRRVCQAPLAIVPTQPSVVNSSARSSLLDPVNLRTASYASLALAALRSAFLASLPESVLSNAQKK